jgi:hypothetical protein
MLHAAGVKNAGMGIDVNISQLRMADITYPAWLFKIDVAL